MDVSASSTLPQYGQKKLTLHSIFAVACDDPYQPFNSHLSYNPVGEQGDDKVTKTLVAGSQAVDTVASGKWLLL